MPDASGGQPLRGCVAWVTGGGRGIGAAIASRLSSAGMRVAVSARTSAQVHEVADSIGGLAIVGDVSNESHVSRMIEGIERSLGPVDLLVNNAGIGHRPDGAIWEVDPGGWWRAFEVNTLGVFLCSRAVSRGMVARGTGRIVNVTSGVAHSPLPPAGVPVVSSAYAPSKAAAHVFSEILAKELEPHGVGVFSISPGLVRTQMTEHMLRADQHVAPPEQAAELVHAIALGRLDSLRGRFLHATRDDVDDLIARADEIVARDLNAIRLRR